MNRLSDWLEKQQQAADVWPGREAVRADQLREGDWVLNNGILHEYLGTSGPDFSRPSQQFTLRLRILNPEDGNVNEQYTVRADANTIVERVPKPAMSPEAEPEPEEELPHRPRGIHSADGVNWVHIDDGSPVVARHQSEDKTYEDGYVDGWSGGYSSGFKAGHALGVEGRQPEDSLHWRGAH